MLAGVENLKYTVGPIPPMNSREWVNLVLDQSDRFIDRILKDPAGGEGQPPSSYKYPQSRKTAGLSRILDEIYQTESRNLIDRRRQRQPSRKINMSASRKKVFYEGLAADIKRSRRYQMVSDLIYLAASCDQVPHGVDGLTKTGIQTLHLMLGGSDRVLVGVKGGQPVWSNVHIQGIIPEVGLPEVPLFYYSESYLYNMPDISQADLEVVPTNPVCPYVLDYLRFPPLEKDLHGWLAAAFHNRRYSGPFNGAVIEMKNSADVKSVKMMQKGNVILADVVTRYGDGSVVIDLTDGFYIDPFKIANLTRKNPNIPPSSWANLVGKLYHDFVTATELPATGRRLLSPRSPSLDGNRNGESVASYQVLPRVFRGYEKAENSSLRQYIGERKSPEPHWVSDYPRRGNESDEHKLRVAQFEQDFNRSLRAHLLPGEFPVIPHTSPRGMEEMVKRFPPYVRDIMMRELEEQRQERVVGKHHVPRSFFEGATFVLN